MPAEDKEKILATNEDNLKDKDSLLKTEYETAIKEMGLNGKYQNIVFYIIAFSSFICGLMITAFPVEKEIPNYVCINRYEFEDFEEYSFYKNNPQFKIIESEECVEKFCKEPLQVLVADYGEMRNFITMLDTMCNVDKFSGEFTKRLFLGRILAIFFTSYISDNIGRKITIHILLVLLLMTNIGFFFFRNNSAFLTITFFANMSMQLFNINTVYSVEIMSDDIYSVLSGAMGLFHTICGVFGIVIMFLFQDFIVLLSIHLVLDVIIIYYAFVYLVETPKFCLYTKDYTQLKESITFIANINGTYDTKILPIFKKIDAICEKNQNTPDTEESKGEFNIVGKISYFISSVFSPYIKIFTRKKELFDLGFLFFPFATVFFVYYGQLMFIERLPGNAQVNSLLIYCSELFAPNIAGYMLIHMKRRTIYSSVFIASIILCALLTQIENAIMVSILVALNAFVISMNFIVQYVIAAELFDCSVKTSAMGVLILLSNLFMVPGDLLLGLFSSPFYFFLIILSISVLCITQLRETKV